MVTWSVGSSEVFMLRTKEQSGCQTNSTANYWNRHHEIQEIRHKKYLFLCLSFRFPLSFWLSYGLNCRHSDQRYLCSSNQLGSIKISRPNSQGSSHYYHQERAGGRGEGPQEFLNDQMIFRYILSWHNQNHQTSYSPSPLITKKLQNWPCSMFVLLFFLPPWCWLLDVPTLCLMPS